MSRGDEETPYAAAEEDTGARQSLSDRPLRCVERCCPFLVRWLEAIGCEEALIVRDVTHLSLYFSCVLSLFCTALWGADVCSGDCVLSRPWLAGVDGYRCAYEALGVIVFFGTLCDSVQMISNYDNDHQVLLRRKCQLMEEVRQETVEALRRAEENAEKLTRMLLKAYEGRVRDHVDEYFSNAWPVLYHGLDRAGEADRALLRELNDLIGRNLDEAGQLAVAYRRRLAVLSERLPGSAEHGHGHLVAPAERRPGFWLLLLKPPLEGMEPGSPPPGHVGIDAEVQRDPGGFVFAPVKEMVHFVSDSLKGDYIQQVQRSHEESFYRQRPARLCGCRARAGGGVEEEEEDAQSAGACACCMPRILAHLLRWLCCSCCWSRRRGFCSEALSGYPKQVKLGCFWIKIISRLHERLIQGLVMTAAFCALYAWSEWRIVSRTSMSDLSEAQEWDCLWDLARRAVVLVALICHIPALLLCLVRIRDLEAIIKITEDIWKVRDIRKVVKELERSVEVECERQGLLQAVEDRVLARTRLVHHFRLHVLRPAVRERPEVLRAATQELVQCLKSINCDLPSAAAWVELPAGAQRRLADRVKERVEEMGKSFSTAPAEAAQAAEATPSVSIPSEQSAASTTSSQNARSSMFFGGRTSIFSRRQPQSEPMLPTESK